MTDPTEKDLHQEQTSLLIDGKILEAVVDKTIFDIAKKAGEQGSDSTAIAQDIDEAVKGRSSEELEQGLAGVGAQNEENITKSGSTKDKIGQRFDSAEKAPEEEGIEELRSKLLNELSKNPNFNKDTATIGGKKIGDLNQAELELQLEKTGNIEIETEEKEKDQLTNYDNPLTVFKVTEAIDLLGNAASTLKDIGKPKSFAATHNSDANQNSGNSQGSSR